jgi:hypothetical protein
MQQSGIRLTGDMTRSDDAAGRSDRDDFRWQEDSFLLQTAPLLLLNHRESSQACAFQRHMQKRGSIKEMKAESASMESRLRDALSNFCLILV